MPAIEAIDIGSVNIVHADRDRDQQDQPGGGVDGRHFPANDKIGHNISKGDHAGAGQQVEPRITSEGVDLAGKIGSELAGGALHLTQQPVLAIIVGKKENEQENEKPGNGSEAAVESQQEDEDSRRIGNKE